MAGFTLADLMKAKKILDEAEKKRPKYYIDGKEYIKFSERASNG
jgi:hypothetical protein